MNLERSAMLPLPRGGKGHDGLGAAAHLGSHGSAVDPRDDFSSALAAVDLSPSPLTQEVRSLVDEAPVLAGPARSADVQAHDLTHGGEPALDSGSQVDMAVLLAQVGCLSAWSPRVGVVPQSNGGLATKEEPTLKPQSGLVLARFAQPAHLIPPADATQPGPVPLTVSTNEMVRSPTNSSPNASSDTDADTDTAAVVVAMDRSLVGVHSLEINLRLDANVGESRFEGQKGLEPSGLAFPNGSRERPIEPKLGARSVDMISPELSGGRVPAAGMEDAKTQGQEAPRPVNQSAAVAVSVFSVGTNGFSHAASDTKARQSLVGSEITSQAIAAPSASALMGAPEGVLRKPDRSAGKAAELHRGSAGEGQWGPYALVSGRPVEAPTATQNLALPTPEAMVAEQVSYWIAGKVQNAELRLDVFGREPVDVSISMKGSEAQVEFRTDQPEVRHVLEGAVGHLKELLKQEGLSLSGVFVGTSGQQRQGAQPFAGQTDGAEGVRQARVEVAEVGGPVIASAGRSGVGRSVDLFV